MDVSLYSVEDPGYSLDLGGQCSKHERVAEPDPQSIHQADRDRGRSHVEEWENEATEYTNQEKDHLLTTRRLDNCCFPEYSKDNGSGDHTHHSDAGNNEAGDGPGVTVHG